MLEQPRILIVDDEPFNLDLLEQELELLGYGSVRAVDGRNALERLQSEAFDLVLLDVMMPGIDGFGVLERMKSHPKWQHIPVIMISAMIDTAWRRSRQSVMRSWQPPTCFSLTPTLSWPRSAVAMIWRMRHTATQTVGGSGLEFT